MSRMNQCLFSTITGLLVFSTNVFTINVFPQVQLSTAVAQNTEAVIYDPPSNVRKTPNGKILCSIKAVTTIDTFGYTNGWYRTYVCGSDGYIHESQLRFESTNQSSSSVNCLVTNINTGQLAVRKSPAGEAIAGLNNNNVVQYINGEFPWYYIKVINGPNNKVDGRTGWVNANYLQCFWD